MGCMACLLSVDMQSSDTALRDLVEVGGSPGWSVSPFSPEETDRDG
jgi:hypothetical protein